MDILISIIKISGASLYAIAIPKALDVCIGNERGWAIRRS